MISLSFFVSVNGGLCLVYGGNMKIVTRKLARRLSNGLKVTKEKVVSIPYSVGMVLYGMVWLKK